MKTERGGRYGSCLWKGKSNPSINPRKAHPYKNCLALVGGFMDKGEDAAHACQREVKRRNQS